MFFGAYYLPSFTLGYLSIIKQTFFIEIRLILKLVMLSGNPLKLKLLIYKVKNIIMTSATEYDCFDIVFMVCSETSFAPYQKPRE